VGDVEERSVKLGDIEVTVLEDGVGGRPLMLVHGFTGVKEDFADEVGPLADLGYHVVSPDLRGHGQSSRPDTEAEYSLELFADDVLALADSLGWQQFDLLGHSMGGMIVQVVVLREPARVSRLILMNTTHEAVSTMDPELAALGVEMARTEGLGAIADLLKFFENPDDNPAYHRVCAERDGYLEWSESKARTPSPVMYAAMLPTFQSTPDRLPALGELSTPTLVIVGELDRAFVGPSREMAAAIEGAVYAEIPTAGHCPQFEATEAWRAVLHGFLGPASSLEPDRAADRS
jgi:pimeloyl-ACP methyl ester carboxylesterase